MLSESHLPQLAHPPIAPLTRLFLFDLRFWLLCQLPAPSLCPCVCHFIDAFLPPHKCTHTSASQLSHSAICYQSLEKPLKHCSSNSAQILLYPEVHDASPPVHLSASIKKSRTGIMIAELLCQKDCWKSLNSHSYTVASLAGCIMV